MRTKEQLEEALAHALSVLDSCTSHMETDWWAFRVKEEIANINAILSPEPEYEDVPVERWESQHPKGYTEWTTFPADAADWRREGRHVIELKGVDRRPVPRPVAREVSVEAEITACGFIAQPLPGGSFRDHPATHGKRVTLTATWEE